MDLHTQSAQIQLKAQARANHSQVSGTQQTCAAHTCQGFKIMRVWRYDSSRVQALQKSRVCDSFAAQAM